MTTDSLNSGYLSHGVLAKCYRIIDFFGNRLFKQKSLYIKGNKLLFINLGFIGDLILFRYVIENFLHTNYQITLVIQHKYSFVFDNIRSQPNLKFIYIKNYHEKKILRGFINLYSNIKRSKDRYSASLHFRGYLGTGVLSTYLARVSDNLIGYGTSGFGFLLNKQVLWQEHAHETQHILDVLRVIDIHYTTINLNIFRPYLANTPQLVNALALTPHNYILIHAVSQNRQKNIPPQLLSLIIAWLMNNTTYQLVFVGSYDELALVTSHIQHYSPARIITTHGEIDFFAIYSLANLAAGFIGIDSSVAHLLSDLPLPKLLIWHKLNTQVQWLPLGDNWQVIQPWQSNHTEETTQWLASLVPNTFTS